MATAMGDGGFVREATNALVERLGRSERALFVTNSRLAVLRPGIIARPGDRIERVYFPIRGSAVIRCQLRSGAAPAVAAIGAEGLIGAEVALGSTTAILRTDVAMPMIAFTIPAETLRRGLGGSSMLPKICGRYVLGLLAQVVREAACAKTHRTSARLALWLVRWTAAAGAPRVRLTHELVAEILGVTRQTVTIGLGALEAAGLIRAGRGWIDVTSTERLAARACECLIDGSEERARIQVEGERL